MLLARFFVTFQAHDSITTGGVRTGFAKFASSATSWGTALVFVTGVCAQESKSIEVASVKPSRNTMADSNLDSVRGRLTATNMTVRELIRLAYGVKDHQIAQAPKWIGSDRFDIAVKSVHTDSKGLEDEKSLVRELLADRFQLTTHREAKQMAVYLLVVAKEGPKLKAHNDAGPRARRGCGRLVGRRVTADDIATILSRQVDHAVFNRTGLAGEYDFQLDFTPDSGPCRAAQDSLGASPATDPSGLPSIYTAVQQQLGLKLESSRGPVELLVIDHVEKPSDN
jgi:uncharacterized protein (TIGR03435 family)